MAPGTTAGKRPRALLPISIGGLLVLCTEAGCGAAPPRLPDTAAARTRDLARFGRRLLLSLQRPHDHAEATSLWLSELDIRRWFSPRVATALTVRRAGHWHEAMRAETGGVSWQPSRFSRLCVQGLRRATPGGAEGLARPTWVFDRVLLVARRPEGDRVAAWVEGTFLWTPEGWRIVDLERVEPPRWEHADLDMARCDAMVGWRP